MFECRGRSPVFTVQLRVMQKRTVKPQESRLSVRPSVRVDCDKTKQSFTDILISHERSFILVF